MSWRSLEERELSLDHRLYTKKAWRPQDSFGYHKSGGHQQRTDDENTWSLVDERNENNIRNQQQEMLLAREVGPISDRERELIRALMLKRLSGL